MVYYIYTLSCPIDKNVKYVGKTNNLKLRYAQHISDFRNMCKVKSWIKSLKLKGLLPIMELVDTCEGEDWRFLESYWICQFKTWGFDLKNLIDGGRGVSYLSEETKLKISKSLKGKKLTEVRRKANCKPVCQYTINGDFIKCFDCISEALKEVNLKFGIKSAIKRKASAGGYQWRDKEGDFTSNLNHYEIKYDMSNAWESIKRKVEEIDATGNVISTYDSIIEAKKITGLNNISAVCTGARKHTKQRFFRHAVDVETLDTNPYQ